MDYEVLTTLDIDSALKKYPIFKGAFPSNLVPISRAEGARGFIINTAKSDRPGEHWTAMIVDGEDCHFFDSFGYELLNLDLLKSLKKIGIIQYKYSSIQTQPFSSGNCGYYCIAFILSHIKGFSYTEFMNIFSYDVIENNKTCYNFIKQYI